MTLDLADSLASYLSKPLSEDQYAREANSLEPNSEFALDAADRTYGQQFYKMYQYRLSTLKDRVDQNAMKKWGHGTKKVDGKKVHKKDKILDITSGEICWVSGTIFCDLHNKLKILHDVENGTDDTLPEIPATYLSEEENNLSAAPLVMLEDESGRAILHNDDFLRENVLVTGCIVAILGIEIQAGIFEIMDVIYPTISPQRPLVAQTGAEKIAFVSGLNVHTEGDHLLKLELLKQYLCGELGSEEDIAKARSISRLVIAGDSILPAPTSSELNVSTNNFGSKNVSKLDIENIKLFDYFLLELLPSVSVTMLPGANDPGEVCLPQQPIHRAFLQANKKYAGTSNLQTVTNPCWLEDEKTGLKILGTSGQNIDDIRRYLQKKKEGQEDDHDNRGKCKLLECCIKWQNIAPTAPDTLYCYPFDNSDPFTLSKETPHVFFAGNQENYASETVTLDLSDSSSIQVLLISIPKFSERGQLVLFDTGTKECEVVTFD